MVVYFYYYFINFCQVYWPVLRIALLFSLRIASCLACSLAFSASVRCEKNESGSRKRKKEKGKEKEKVWSIQIQSVSLYLRGEVLGLFGSEFFPLFVFALFQDKPSKVINRVRRLHDCHPRQRLQRGKKMREREKKEEFVDEFKKYIFFLFSF